MSTPETTRAVWPIDTPIPNSPDKSNGPVVKATGLSFSSLRIVLQKDLRVERLGVNESSNLLVGRLEQRPRIATFR